MAHDLGARFGLSRFAWLVLLALPATGCQKSAPSAGSVGVDTSGRASLSVISSDVASGGTIAKTFTCDGDDESPAISWSGAPPSTKSFALIVDDPDAPGGTFTHWIVFDLPPSTSALPQATSGVGVAGKNEFGNDGYNGPCPPPGSPHHYFFRLYALDVAAIGQKPGASRADVDAAIKDHVVAGGALMATFGR